MHRFQYLQRDCFQEKIDISPQRAFRFLVVPKLSLNEENESASYFLPDISNATKFQLDNLPTWNSNKSFSIEVSILPYKPLKVLLQSELDWPDNYLLNDINELETPILILNDANRHDTLRNQRVKKYDLSSVVQSLWKDSSRDLLPFPEKQTISIQFEACDMIGFSISKPESDKLELELPIFENWKPVIDFLPEKQPKFQLLETAIELTQTNEGEFLDVLEKLPTLSTISFLDFNDAQPDIIQIREFELELFPYNPKQLNQEKDLWVPDQIELSKESVAFSSTNTSKEFEEKTFNEDSTFLDMKIKFLPVPKLSPFGTDLEQDLLQIYLDNLPSKIQTAVLEIHMKGLTDTENLYKIYDLLLPFPKPIQFENIDIPYPVILEFLGLDKFKISRWEELDYALTATLIYVKNVEKIIQDDDFIEEATHIRELLSNCAIDEEIEIEDDGLAMSESILSLQDFCNILPSTKNDRRVPVKSSHTKNLFASYKPTSELNIPIQPDLNLQSQVKKRKVQSIQDQIDEFMVHRGKVQKSDITRYHWKSESISSPEVIRVYDFQLAIVEEIGRRNTMLLLPFEISFFPITALVIYNVLNMSPPLSRVLWVYVDNTTFLKSMQFHKRYFLETDYQVSAIPLDSDHLTEESPRVLFTELSWAEKNLTYLSKEQFSLVIFEPTRNTHGEHHLQYKNIAMQLKGYAEQRKQELSFLVLSQEMPLDISAFQEILDSYSIEYIVTRALSDSDVSEYLSHNRINIVDPSDAIKKLRTTIKNAAAGLMRELVNLRILTEAHSFGSLTLEYIRYLMNQERKKSSNSEEFSLKQHLLLNLFTMLKINGYLKDVGITAAYEYFVGFCIEGKYREAVMETQEALAEHLTRCKEEVDAGLYESNPSLTALKLLVQENLKKKGIASKVLILIHNPDIAIANVYPAEVLNDFKGNLSDLLEKNRSVNCLIMQDSILPEQFSWNEFGLVIEYGTDILPKTTCLVSLASLFSLLEYVKLCSEDLESESLSSKKTNLWIDQLRKNFTTDRGSLKIDKKKLSLLSTNYQVSTQKAKDIYKDIPVTVIIGEAFLQKQDLIYQLNLNFGVRCFERSLTLGEDIILDDRTCMLFYPLRLLTPRLAKEHLKKLCKKYSQVWIIFECYEETKPIPQYIQLCISHLMNGLQSLPEGLAVCIRQSYSVESTCGMIRSACYLAYDSSECYESFSKWADRSFIPETEMQGESILCKIAILQPFTANLMLAFAPIHELMRANLEVLTRHLPCIMNSILEAFVLQRNNANQEFTVNSAKKPQNTGNHDIRRFMRSK